MVAAKKPNKFVGRAGVDLDDPLLALHLGGFSY
jgi:hypothetical protein